jgi:hypothetical protein
MIGKQERSEKSNDMNYRNVSVPVFWIALPLAPQDENAAITIIFPEFIFFCCELLFNARRFGGISVL